MTRALRLTVLLVTSFTLSGCALPFYWQAIGGHLELMRKRTPIDALLADPQIEPTLRTTLSGVAAIRRFAVTDLQLPDNDSYTSYADLGRPYVVWNVVAADEFSIEPTQSCFPFAGCVAYRGFFERRAAERFQARLAGEGLDTFVGGATAYSTLGYFDDPVLSTMIGGGAEYIASLLFHELAHQKLYIRDDSEFSEAFATTVEEYGTERWLTQRGEIDALDRYHRRLRLRADFADLVISQQSRLSAVYAGTAEPEAKRAAKAEVFTDMRAEYAQLKARWGGIGDYDPWFAQPMNNAVLASVATYRKWLPGLRWRLQQAGLATFYEQMTELADLTPEERDARLEVWLREASPPGILPQPG